jgi:hypothetical protein
MTYEEFVAKVTAAGLLDGMTRICRAHGVLLPDVFRASPKGSARFARGRMFCWLNDDVKKTTREIAELFGYKDNRHVWNITQNWRKKHRSTIEQLDPWSP